MPRGASPKREHEYKELEQRFERSGRYKGREEEVAARIVNKQRAQYGETKRARRQEATGRSPDRDLPIDRYRHLTVSQIIRQLADLSNRDKRRVRDYEREHKHRKTLLEELDRELHH